MTEERLLAHLERLAGLPALQRGLLACSDVATLLAQAADLARTSCGFRRGIVLSVERGELVAAETDALRDPASDQLRRTALARAIPLLPGTEEAELIRRAEEGAAVQISAASVVHESLGLEQQALGVIAPESRALALLVLDRPEPAVDVFDRGAVDAFAAMIAVTLQHVVLRARLAELSLELGHLTVSAQALMSEMIEAPITLPVSGRHGPAFPPVDAVQSAPMRLTDVLSQRELTIASLIAEGRSNREIADELILSPETVKTHVARILRKLNASNRAEAVARYLRLMQRTP
jgi:DNA-binding CsgD family transcriptional regulator